jgi:hypothetical protein
VHTSGLVRRIALAVAGLGAVGAMLAPASQASVPNTFSGGGNVINCSAKVNYPHSSTHVPGTVNATGSVTCSAPVAKISFTMYLNESGFEVASKSFSNTGKSSLSGNVAVACAVGTTHPYQAFLTGTVTAPPGYSPPAAGIGNQSPNINVKCA